MKIQVVIEYDTDVKSVSVGGPIGDKVLMHGILGAAGDAVRDFHSKDQQEQRERRVVPATFNLVQP